jgi:PIN domain nuclease of toxin-antitoxin system
MILLDTHVVVWLMTAPERISRAAASALEDRGVRGQRPALSAASIFELGYGIRRGRILMHGTSIGFLDRMRANFELVPVTEAIAFEAASFPEPFHGDPMDRIITATALLGDFTLLTNDNRIRKSGLCRVIW